MQFGVCSAGRVEQEKPYSAHAANVNLLLQCLKKQGLGLVFFSKPPTPLNNKPLNPKNLCNPKGSSANRRSTSCDRSL